MAATSETSEDYVRRLNQESALLEAEARKLRAEADRMWAERTKQWAKPDWLNRLFDRSPGWSLLVGLALAIAIMGLGALPVILLRH